MDENFSSFRIAYKDGQGTLHEKNELSRVYKLPTWDIVQVREFTSYSGQKHMPGLFWMSRMGQLVGYESRLEMFVLMQLDFNPAVTKVVSQPFTLHCQLKGKPFKHTPDYLTLEDTGKATVIDAKPRAEVDKLDNRRAFAATEGVCAEIGWHYSVQSEADPTFLANLKWLTGYRKRPPFADSYADDLIKVCQGSPLPLKALVEKVGPPYLVRPVLFHLLWRRLLSADMYMPFTDETVVDLPKEAFSRGI